MLVIGGGGSGLRAAIAADEAGADVAVISKLHPVRSHTGAAEGGINAALDDDDSWTDHAYETVKGADYVGDAPAIETFTKEIRREVLQLERWGMAFSREEDGTVAQRPFGGMSYPRTTFAGAETGHHLLHTLYQQVSKRGIDIYDEWFVTSLAVTNEKAPTDRTCHGVVAYDLHTGEVAGFHARDGVILATGGNGQAFDHTTNATANTGDGMAMAYRAGAPLEDMEFVQFHPTTLPSTGVLITEGVRGEGGILYNTEGERFMFESGYANNVGELASRDVVSRAELTEVAEGRGFDDDHVMLDMRHLGEERILDRLENIVHLAQDFEGVDPLEEPMPVKPGQHYEMGGIETDENGATAIDGLYAVGESACVSIHGANRLGGNALAELVVFGARAGRAAAGDRPDPATLTTGRTAEAEAADQSLPIDPGPTKNSEQLATDGGRQQTDPTAVIETAVAREQERIQTLLDRDGTYGYADVRDFVQQTMTDHVNVFREREGLKQALSDIQTARERYQQVSVDDQSRSFNYDLIHAIETRNIIDVAETIALGALLRTESRGAHWRKRYQTRDDENWLKHTMLSWNNGSPEVWYKPVALEGEAGRYEPKERSY